MLDFLNAANVENILIEETIREKRTFYRTKPPLFSKINCVTEIGSATEINATELAAQPKLA
jgi:hypothetical protein